MVFRFRYLFMIGVLLGIIACNHSCTIAFISETHPSKVLAVYNNSGQVTNATNAFYAIWNWTDSPNKHVTYSWESDHPPVMTNYLKFTVPQTPYFGIFLQAVTNNGNTSIVSTTADVSSYSSGTIHFWFKADKVFRGKLAAFIKSDNQDYNGSYTPGMAYWYIPDSFCDNEWHETNMNLNNFTLDGRDSINFNYGKIANFFGIMSRPDVQNLGIDKAAYFYLDDIQWTTGNGTRIMTISDSFNRANSETVGSPWLESEANQSKVSIENNWLKLTGGSNGNAAQNAEAYIPTPGGFGSFDISFRFKVDATNFITTAGTYQDTGSGQPSGYYAYISGSEINVYKILNLGLGSPLYGGVLCSLVPGETYSCHFSKISGNIDLTITNESNPSINFHLTGAGENDIYRFNRTRITGGGYNGTNSSSLYIDDFVLKMY